MTPSQGSSMGVAYAPKTFSFLGPVSAAAGAGVGAGAIAGAGRARARGNRGVKTQKRIVASIILPFLGLTRQFSYHLLLPSCLSLLKPLEFSKIRLRITLIPLI